MVKKNDGKALAILKIQRDILCNLLRTRQKCQKVGMPTDGLDREIGFCLRLMGGISSAW